MKHLLIALIAVFASTANAGNGSGTMLVAPQDLDSTSFDRIPVIRVDAIIDKDTVQVSQIRADSQTGKFVVDHVLYDARHTSQNLIDAIQRSIESGNWQTIAE